MRNMNYVRNWAITYALALLLASGPAAAQKAPNGKSTLPAITVADAGGKVVGRFDSNRVLASMAGLAVWIDLDRSPGGEPSKMGWADALLLFATADCTGTPHVFPPTPPLGGFATRVSTSPTGKSWLYVVTGTAMPVTIAATFLGGVCTPSTAPSTAFVVALAAPVELSAIFSLPLELQ